MTSKRRSIAGRLIGRPAQALLSALAAPRHRIDARRLFNHITGLAPVDHGAPSIDPPFIALIVPVYNTPPDYLDAMLASVRRQARGLWELILSDDGSSEPATLRWLAARSGDADLTILRHPRNAGIAHASNAAIRASRARWIAFLDHDDALAPGALEQVRIALAANPDCRFLYTDEVVADRRLRPVDLFFKPEFDPVLLSGVNYLNHLSVYLRERVLEFGGLREGFEGSQDYDLALRYVEGLDQRQIVHLAYPAYIWRRDGRSYSVRRFAEATENARKALADAHGVGMSAIETTEGGLHRVTRRGQRRPWPKVSVVIPSRDAFPLIDRTLAGLREHTDYPDLEIIVIDNGSTDPRVLDLYERCRAGGPPFQARIEPEPFNFSRAVNKGVACAEGEFALLLNNDVEILHADWLKEMVECFDYPDVGVVGAKLLYPDGTLQHAGVIVGFGGLAGHWYLNLPAAYPGPMGRLRVRQSLSAVTGACFLVSKACLEVVGAFDEDLFAIAYNDVDFCLRAREAGFRIVWTPFATLKHHESATRGSDEEGANRLRFRVEQDNLRRRHRTDVYQDFAISPWYTRDRSDPRWRWLEALPVAR